MNRNYITILFLCSILITAAGCKKYLQVQPVGAYTESQVFANQKAVEQALNGLYINLIGNDLYGASLTQTHIELIGQQYRAFSNGVSFYELFQHNDYNSPQPREAFDNIWKSAYAIILSANLFVDKLDLSVQQGVISEEKANLMKGEAIGIRAMLHFDMLRIFGPAYNVGADEQSIPYYTKADASIQPFSSSAEIINKIETDLNTAEELLVKDAIKESGVVTGQDFYINYRNQRMNYFAVKALKARVYLWADKKAEAHDAALEVITEAEAFFPWVTFGEVIGATAPDRIFSNELLFALYNRELYNNFAAYFHPSLTDASLLTPETANLLATYENNQNDYRFASSWRTVPGKSVRVLYKYEDISSTQRWGYLQPMIRKSELYYILAETETDPVQALNYLNIVRNKRGLANLSVNASLPEEIMKEYRKEFYAEGQIFFYYKRNNVPAVKDAVTNIDRALPYIVPLPLSETTPR